VALGEAVYRPAKAVVPQTAATPCAEDVSRAAELLNRAERPIVYFGGGVTSSNAGPELRALVEKVDMLFTDVEIEGKKQGYVRAAEEYEKAFREIENEYDEVKSLIKNKSITYNARLDMLNEKLKIIEVEKQLLEKQLIKQEEEFSIKMGVPTIEIHQAIMGQGLMPTSSYYKVDILDVVYRYKERQQKEAEIKGYLEAKTLYDEKLSKMKMNIMKLRNEGDEEIRELLLIISDVLKEIADGEMRIAEMQIIM